MPSKTVVVGSTIGLHARPAAIISEAAAALNEPVLLATPDGYQANAASSIAIMRLGAEQGTPVKVTSDSQEAVDAIAALVAQNLDA